MMNWLTIFSVSLPVTIMNITLPLNRFHKKYKEEQKNYVFVTVDYPIIKGSWNLHYQSLLSLALLLDAVPHITQSISDATLFSVQHIPTQSITNFIP